jgi:hypothetical protein
MKYFDFFFPLSMILFPLVFSLFVRSHPDPRDPDPQATLARVARLRKRLWLGTGAAVVLFLGVYLFASPRAASFLWILAFPLWFAITAPLLQAKDRGWMMTERPQTRAATLERRDVAPPKLALTRFLASILWLALFVLALWPFLRGQAEWRSAWFLMFSVFGAGWLLMERFATRLSVLEAEPMDSAGSPELMRGYESLRRFKVWGWFTVSTMAMLAFSVPPVLLARDPEGWLTVAIWVGAGGGAFVGLLGGVFGVTADIRRTRLNRLYQDLADDDPAGGA